MVGNEQIDGQLVDSVEDGVVDLVAHANRRHFGRRVAKLKTIDVPPGRPRARDHGVETLHDFVHGDHGVGSYRGRRNVASDGTETQADGTRLRFSA